MIFENACDESNTHESTFFYYIIYVCKSCYMKIFLLQNAGPAQSPLGQIPPNDGMPGGPMPPGFFPVSCSISSRSIHKFLSFLFIIYMSLAWSTHMHVAKPRKTKRPLSRFIAICLSPVYNMFLQCFHSMWFIYFMLSVVYCT